MWGVTSLSRTQGVSGWVGTCYVGGDLFIKDTRGKWVGRDLLCGGDLFIKG